MDAVSSDERHALVSYFRDIDGGDVVALAPWKAGYDQSDGHHHARQCRCESTGAASTVG